MKRIIALLLLLALPCAVSAQDQGNAKGGDVTNMEALDFNKVFNQISAEDNAPAATDTVKQSRVENEFYYVVILSLLCLVSLSLVLIFLLKLKQDTQPRDIVSGAGLILIVFGTIILVLIVDTTEQLTAAIGILGAIAGYLFRSAQESSRDARVKQEV
jgi:hypothetical protein